MTSYIDIGLNPSTTYSYTIVAFDAAGNVSPMSAAATVTTLASASTGPTAPPIAGNWSLSFDDEFNSLNNSTWSNDYWWNGNAGTQATFDPKQLSVSNGVLAQTAVASPETANNGVTNPYRSGLMTTRRRQRDHSGEFYVHIRLRRDARTDRSRKWNVVRLLDASRRLQR